MVNSSYDIRVVDIDALKKGMFVVAIESQTGHSHVSQSGLITQNRQITQLKSKGVKTLKVDWARSMFEQPVPPPANGLERSASKPYISSDETQKRLAKKLFHEAKVIQGNYFKQLQHGEAIDIAPMERVAEKLIDSLENQSNAMLCLARIRAKDRYLMEHSLNVGMLLAYFGSFLGQSKGLQKQLLMGGMLHDIGKIYTPNAILHKPDKLTEQEFIIMREHVVHSYSILRMQKGVSKVMLDIASNHHERLDGLGYPHQISGEQLSTYTRMANIIDCYDALTADRVYKSGMPPTAAFRILLKGVGSQFDKQLVEKFIRCMGVYPVGTLVKLISGRLGLVVARNQLKPLQPVLKLIYSAVSHTHLEVTTLDLSKVESEEIEGAVSARDYDICLDHYLELAVG
ncbi:HD-GYP domain-containing protein [Agarivorans sp. QJM3NY_29]|uniref:HD-GYP domain-containing protein n=1 Tax=unclassified Agarivorans TaxID=2636026 RepID=UPI003D7D2878